jgi:hypothetical protein
MNSINWKNAVPATVNAWNYMVTDLATIPSVITTITPLFYMGAIAGSEFLTYDLNKLYFVLDIDFSSNSRNVAGWPSITFHDYNDAAGFIASIGIPVWDGAAFTHSPNLIQLSNKYFARVVASSYTFMSFNGYRLTIS